MPVRGGFGPYSTALGSRVVHVVPSRPAARRGRRRPRPVNRPPGNAAARCFTISAASSTWAAVPLPRHSLNSTGSATGEEQNDSLTRSPRSPRCYRMRFSCRPARTRHRPTGPGRPCPPPPEERPVAATMTGAPPGPGISRSAGPPPGQGHQCPRPPRRRTSTLAATGPRSPLPPPSPPPCAARPGSSRTPAPRTAHAWTGAGTPAPAPPAGSPGRRHR